MPPFLSSLWKECISAHVLEETSLFPYIYIYIYVCMYVCMCICICICIYIAIIMVVVHRKIESMYLHLSGCSLYFSSMYFIAYRYVKWVCVGVTHDLWIHGLLLACFKGCSLKQMIGSSEWKQCSSNLENTLQKGVDECNRKLWQPWHCRL